MTKYQKQKELARQAAIDWQNDFPNHNYSYYELCVWVLHFHRLGRKYGLVREFRENGII